MKVSDEVGYTPSGLVHMMNSIENELGLKIINRTNQGVTLTENGRTLMPLFEQFSQLNSRMISEAKKLREKTDSTLKVGTYASIATHWLPSVITAFRTEHPDFDVELTVLEKPECYQALETGRIDLAFCSKDRLSKCPFELLKSDEFFAVLPTNSPDAPAITSTVASESTSESAEFPLANFNDMSFIMPSLKSDEDVRRILSEHDVHPELLASVADDSTVISMVAAGMGSSILSELTLRGHDSGVLTFPLRPRLYRELGIIYRCEGESTPITQFVQFAKSMRASL